MELLIGMVLGVAVGLALYQTFGRRSPEVKHYVNNVNNVNHGDAPKATMMPVLPEDLVIVSLNKPLNAFISGPADIGDIVNRWREREGGGTIITELPVNVIVLRHFDPGDDEGDEDEKIEVDVTKGTCKDTETIYA